MKERLLRTFLILVGLTMIFALAGCTPEEVEETVLVPEETEETIVETEEVIPTEPEEVEPEPVVLRIGEVSDVDCWNPFGCFAAWGYGFLTYEGFTDHGPGPSSPGTPRLAESWEFSEDGMTATIHLYKGITFSDGTPFTAQTAVDYINWFNSTDLAYWFAETMYMESVEALDDTTLQYTT